MREQALGEAGVGEDATTGPLDLTTTHVSFSDLHTRGKTLYVIPGGPEFDTIAVEGRLPGDVWVPAKGPATDDDGVLLDLVVDTSAAGVYVLGADYLGLRVVGAGGTDPVEADPEADPPVEGVEGSTLEAGIIG
jgi:hypothetical protein